MSRYGLVVAWLTVIVVFSLLRPSTFFTAVNLQTILSAQAILLILTIALLPSLTAGEYDLSIAGAMGVSFVTVGYLNVLQGWPIGLVVLAVLGIGLAIGLINIVLIIFVGVESIVATLGLGTLLIGASMGINQLPIAGISPTLINISRYQIAGVQAVFYYGLALTVATWYVFSFTPLGRYLYFVGAGRDVARLSGIRVDLIRAGTLLFSSVLGAIAGLLLAGVLGSADPNAAAQYLLPAFAGAFLGATAITPGRFNPWGSFVAVYFLLTGITGLELLGLSGWIEQVFYGASLVVAVTLSRLAGRKRIS
jgi:ribose transport system permease protein